MKCGEKLVTKNLFKLIVSQPQTTRWKTNKTMTIAATAVTTTMIAKEVTRLEQRASVE
jgi:hypothetical protein